MISLDMLHGAQNHLNHLIIFMGVRATGHKATSARYIQ